MGLRDLMNKKQVNKKGIVENNRLMSYIENTTSIKPLGSNSNRILIETIQKDLIVEKKLETEEDVSREILEYFTLCSETNRIPTISGIARCLCKTRKEITNGEYPEHFKRPIRAALSLIEEIMENKLMSEKANSNYKLIMQNNFNWKDKQSVETNITIKVHDPGDYI